MPTLKFISPHKSIHQFSPIQLDAFSVLTGLNGCGKTHLLESILLGKSSLDNIPVDQIKYFDFRTFFVENEQTYTDQQLDQEKIQAWNTLIQTQNNTNVKQRLGQLRTQLVESNYQSIVDLASSLNKPLLRLENGDFPNNVLLEAFKNYRRGYDQIFDHPNFKNNHIYQGVKNHGYEISVSLDSLDESEFKDFFVPVMWKNEFLPTQLSKVFLNYKKKEYQELVIKKAEAELYNEEVLIKNEYEFQEKFGPKPWVIIEEIMSQFSSLDFSISNPDAIRFRHDQVASFTVQLKSKSTGHKIPFNDLSSGEKILFALVLSIYKSAGNNIFPSVLLLDEIDASLHPSMINNLLEVIRDIFVKQHKVKVLLASHSPSTIALTPEKSIFVVNKNNQQEKILKQSKGSALNILTEGFISLSEGLNILDQIAQKNLNIFTEGYNTKYLVKALELLAPDLLGRVEIMKNIADRTGKNQLPVLYDFFLRLEHKNNVLFVYDCDVNGASFHENNNSYYYVLPQNESNTKFVNGIENIFPEGLISEDHYEEKTATNKNGVITTTKRPNKNLICEHITENGKKEDFTGFLPLIEKIRDILANNGSPSFEKVATDSLQE